MAKWRSWAKDRVTRMRADESAQGLAEYALILALVALVCIAGLGLLGQAIVGSPGFALFN